MSANVHKVIDLVGTSAVSVDDAINTAIAQCAKTIRHLEWFQVDEIRGTIANGKAASFQVVMKVGFRFDDGRGG